MRDSSRETVRFDNLKWMPPVERVEDLPPATEEDADIEYFCYVQSEDAVYFRTNGIWVKSEDRGR